jgi:hypothetical protein
MLCSCGISSAHQSTPHIGPIPWLFSRLANGFILPGRACLLLFGNPRQPKLGLGLLPGFQPLSFCRPTLLSRYLVFAPSFLFLFLYLAYRNASKANWLEKRNTASSSRLLTPILSSLYASSPSSSTRHPSRTCRLNTYSLRTGNVLPLPELDIGVHRG